MKIQPSRFGWYNISDQGIINMHDAYILENSESSIMYHKKHGWRVRIPWKLQWIFSWYSLIHCANLIYYKTSLRSKQAYLGTPKDPNLQPDQIRLKCKERCIENCLQNNKNGQFYNSNTADGGKFFVDSTIEIQCPDVTIPEDWFPRTKPINFPINPIPGKHRNVFKKEHKIIYHALQIIINYI